MAKKYLLYIHGSERFDKEKNKSGLVNELLNQHYGNFIASREALKEAPVPTKNRVVVSEDDPRVFNPLSIPGVEVASEAVCKGTHHMSREDCGKLDCPWK